MGVQRVFHNVRGPTSLSLLEERTNKVDPKQGDDPQTEQQDAKWPAARVPWSTTWCYLSVAGRRVTLEASCHRKLRWRICNEGKVTCSCWPTKRETREATVLSDKSATVMLHHVDKGMKRLANMRTWLIRSFMAPHGSSKRNFSYIYCGGFWTSWCGTLLHVGFGI